MQGPRESVSKARGEACAVKKILASVLVAVLFSLLGPIYPTSAQDFEEKVDYAILPGVGIGAIALGMTARLALAAMARYGKVVLVRAFDDYSVYQANHLYVVFDLTKKGAPVEEVTAIGDSQFYVVVPRGLDEDNVHLLSQSVDSVLTQWGYFCTGDQVGIGGMPMLRGRWNHYGADILVVPSPFGLFVVGATVYVADALTLDRVHELTCGESDPS
jgi:hypothetical protein